MRRFIMTCLCPVAHKNRIHDVHPTAFYMNIHTEIYFSWSPSNKEKKQGQEQQPEQWTKLDREVLWARSNNIYGWAGWVLKLIFLLQCFCFCQFAVWLGAIKIMQIFCHCHWIMLSRKPQNYMFAQHTADKQGIIISFWSEKENRKSTEDRGQPYS